VRDTLSALIHAPSKVGKSTLLSTSPPPLCVFDVEGSWKFIKRRGFCVAGVHNTKACECPPLRKREWDPVREAPPRYDGTWDACMVNVREWSTLQMGYAHLLQSPHDFRSLLVDSVTESQRKLKTQLRGLEGMRIQDWGDLLVYMDKWFRDMRDLALIDSLPVQFVGFVAETDMYEGKWRPAMQGQIKRSMPYWVDLCGYYYTELEQDATGSNTVKVKKLLIMSDHPQFECGERVAGMLGDVVVRPDITDMMKRIYGSDVFESVEVGKSE